MKSRVFQQPNKLLLFSRFQYQHYHRNSTKIYVRPKWKVNMRGIIVLWVSPIGILSTNFDDDSFVKELDVDAKFLDNLLVQVPLSEVKRALDEQAPVPYSDTREPEQSGTGSPSVLPDMYFALCL